MTTDLSEDTSQQNDAPIAGENADSETDPSEIEAKSDIASKGQAATTPLAWLADLPAGMFSISLGLIGLGLAWRWADTWTQWSQPIGNTILILAVAIYLMTAIAYFLKFLLYRDNVIADIKDPGISNFLSAIAMTPMLASAVIIPIWPVFGERLWFVAALGILFLVIRQIQFWITRNFEIRATSPAWFIPISGVLLGPITGIQLGYIELSWLLFSLGLGFWIALFVIVLNRVIFHDQLPARYVPTLFLLMTPPSAAFLSYAQITEGSLDPFAKFLYHFALATSLLVFSMARLFTRLPFSLTWWAYTFPLDAITQASFHYADLAQSELIHNIAIGFLCFTTLIVIIVSTKTIDAFLRGTLFDSEVDHHR